MVFEAGSIRYLGFYYTNLNARKLPTLRYCVGYAAILFQIEAKEVQTDRQECRINKETTVSKRCLCEENL